MHTEANLPAMAELDEIVCFMYQTIHERCAVGMLDSPTR